MYTRLTSSVGKGRTGDPVTTSSWGEHTVPNLTVHLDVITPSVVDVTAEPADCSVQADILRVIG